MFQIFGSPSSTDLDLVVFVKKIPSIKASADLCKHYSRELAPQLDEDKPLNINIACLKNGIITDVHKGTVDELNNALLQTYLYHKQYHPQQITRSLSRDVDLKVLRCARKILAYFTRTAIRKEVKLALQGNLKDQLALLQQINIADFTDLGRKGTPVEFRKTLAFQLGQTLALDQGVELYTKEAIWDFFPELGPFLKRDSQANQANLQGFIDEFILVGIRQLPKMKSLVEYKYQGI